MDEALEEALAHLRFRAEVGVRVRVRDDADDVCTLTRGRSRSRSAHGSKKWLLEISRNPVGHVPQIGNIMAGVGSGWAGSEHVGVHPGVIGSSAWFLSLV